MMLFSTTFRPSTGGNKHIPDVATRARIRAGRPPAAAVVLLMPRLIALILTHPAVPCCLCFFFFFFFLALSRTPCTLPSGAVFARSRAAATAGCQEDLCGPQVTWRARAPRCASTGQAGRQRPAAVGSVGRWWWRPPAPAVRRWPAPRECLSRLAYIGVLVFFWVVTTSLPAFSGVRHTHASGVGYCARLVFSCCGFRQYRGCRWGPKLRAALCRARLLARIVARRLPSWAVHGSGGCVSDGVCVHPSHP